MSLLEFVNLTYTYDGQQPLLRGASGQLERGKLYGILGPSGCGKTTLLSLLGGLDSPQGGRILFQGKDIAETGLGRHRRRHVFHGVGGNGGHLAQAIVIEPAHRQVPQMLRNLNPLVGAGAVARTGLEHGGLHVDGNRNDQ